MLLGTTLLALGLAASPNAQAEDGTANYNKGFIIESANGNHKLKIGARVQARAEFEHVEDAEDSDLAFSIPRARLKL